MLQLLFLYSHAAFFGLFGILLAIFAIGIPLERQAAYERVKTYC